MASYAALKGEWGYPTYCSLGSWPLGLGQAWTLQEAVACAVRLCGPGNYKQLEEQET